MQTKMMVTMLHKISSGTISTGYRKNTNQNNTVAANGGRIATDINIS